MFPKTSLPVFLSTFISSLAVLSKLWDVFHEPIFIHTIPAGKKSLKLLKTELSVKFQIRRKHELS